MNKKAFTLIELLIVIAIISILALIAVPNFLEAQTRAKVAKTLSHFRTGSVALEAYMVDQNNYPTGYRTIKKIPFDGLSTFYHCPVDFIGTTFQLSTPIAYISSGASLTDPFSKFSGTSYEGTLTADTEPAQTGTLIYQRLGPDLWMDPLEHEIAKSITQKSYVLASFGPDTFMTPFIEYPHTPTKNPNTDPYDPVYSMKRICTTLTPVLALPKITDSLYDPTNGTMSNGDLFCFGGVAISVSQGVDSLHKQ